MSLTRDVEFPRSALEALEALEEVTPDEDVVSDEDVVPEEDVLAEEVLAEEVLLDEDRTPRSPEGSPAGRPGTVRLTLVVPMYAVAPYLPAFLASVAGQRPGRYGLECVFVDDGSTDGSAGIVRDWIGASKPEGVEARLLRQENLGVSAARNRGLAAATGDWVSFPDPDDMLDEAYLEQVADFLLSDKGARSVVVGTNLIKYIEADDRYLDNHSLRFKFARQAKVVHLDASPHYVHVHAASTFFRRSRLQAAGVRFIEGLHASEDGLFVADALAAADEPLLGLVPSARFYYRKRAAADSAVDRYRTDALSYFERFERGYLPLLERLHRERGSVPEWVANQVLYELKWLFVAEQRVSTRASTLTDEQRAAFLRQTGEVLRHIDARTILGFRTTRMPIELKHLLLLLKGLPLPDPAVYVAELDPRRRMMLLRYLYVGELPEEEFLVRARRVEPLHAKQRTFEYFGQRLLRERRVWLPATSWLAVKLDGQQQELRLGWLQDRSFALTERQVWSHFDAPLPADLRRGRRRASAPPAGAEDGLRELVQRGRKLVRRARAASKAVSAKARRAVDRTGVVVQTAAARTPPASLRYRRAWVLMDRFTAAGDNAEHLYRHLRQHHRGVNAWFVLDRRSSDWPRLQQEGFRLVPYGSGRHVRLMLNAAHLVSSHVNVEIIKPLPKRYGHHGDWAFTFLQHGVIKDDLSAWVNGKPVDRFVTSTRPEFDSIAGDSAYLVTSKETVLTGLPRFDRLKRLARERPKDVLLLAPTWRESLMAPNVPGAPQRELADRFASSDFAVNWFGLLRDPRLAAAAARADLEVVFLPHPVLGRSITSADVPSHVRLEQYEGSDVQELFARARLMVTDFSSVAFDVTYAGGEVLYFQFDRDAVFTGGHTVAKGYFDYDRDGFGPVALDRDAAVREVEDLLGGRRPPEDERLFRERRAVFAHDDEGNCERVVQAIRELDIPVAAV